MDCVVFVVGMIVYCGGGMDCVVVGMIVYCGGGDGLCCCCCYRYDSVL